MTTNVAPTFYVKQGDLLPALRTTCLKADDTPLDLTSATGVTFRMWRRSLPAGAGLVASGAAVIVDAAAGVVEYPWQSGDTDEPGTHHAEFVATFPGPKNQTLPTVGYITVVVIDSGLPG